MFRLPVDIVLAKKLSQADPYATNTGRIRKE
jgi:hypothetical protein